MNRDYLRYLVKAMYAIPDFPALNEYGSKIFGYPVKNTWKLFRHIVKKATEDSWVWSQERELASYPSVEVPTFEEFATIMLHEATHGWCYFLKDAFSSDYPNGLNEEQICWNVSKMTCELLHIPYQEELVGWCYQLYLCRYTDPERYNEILEKLPVHLQR